MGDAGTNRELSAQKAWPLAIARSRLLGRRDGTYQSALVDQTIKASPVRSRASGSIYLGAS